MTDDTRTSDEIERDISEERARMSDSINNLQKKFSVEAIVGDIGDMFRSQGGDLGRVVSQTVGRNPAALALIGVGFAWLLLGRESSRSAYDNDDSWGDETDRRGNRAGYSSGGREAYASGRGEDRGTFGQDDYWYGNDKIAEARKSASRRTGGAGAPGWEDPKSGKGVVGAVHGAAQTAAHAVSEAVSGAASSVSQAASGLSDRLSHGLEDLSEEARSRVLAARRAAHDARESSRLAMQKGARGALNFFEDQPLVVGALAVALGAAMGGILPHSRIEDETLGKSSDRLFAQAQVLYREERDKAMAAMRMAASDVKDEIREAGSDLEQLLPEGKNVGDVIVDRAAKAATRVYDRASGSVDHEDPDSNRV